MNFFWKPKIKIQSVPELTTSILYNEATFYKQFVQDLLEAEEEVIIESPYITKRRLEILKPIFERLVHKGIQVFIITRDPLEHDRIMAEQSEAGIQYFEALGPQVLLISGGHHRKLAMIDRKVLWEGSLNILSQSSSREHMRRTNSRKLTVEAFQFHHLDRLDVFRK
jgi:phosphatidylserine/phosphatidylglycerophosphate/cardiolipin synthase-like enzyme